MAKDLQCEAEGGERPTSRVQRRHGGQDAQRYLARRLIRGDGEGVAIGVVLYHRAVRRQLGGGPRIPIWSPDAAHFLARAGPNLGSLGQADRAPYVYPEDDRE